MTEPSKSRVVMSRSGFCAFPSTPEHKGCPNAGCVCACHGRSS